MDRERELLVDELRQAVGDEPVDRQPSRLGATLRASRPMLLLIGAALLIVGAVVSLTLGNWIFLGVAVLFYALVSTVVVGTAVAISAEQDRPEPTTDPRWGLSELAEQVGERSRRAS